MGAFPYRKVKMNVPPVSVERAQKCVVNFEIYSFLKKAANLPHPPLVLCSSALSVEMCSGLETEYVLSRTLR